MSEDRNNCCCNCSQFKCSGAVASAVPVPLCVAPTDSNDVERLLATGSIPYVNADDNCISYEMFFKRFLLKNVPCMIGPSVTRDWSSRQLWLESDKSINWEYLLRVYKDATVSVVNCNDVEYKDGYGSRDCLDVKFEQYVKCLYEGEDEFSTKLPGESPSCWYLKDWHIMRFHKQRQEEGQQQAELPYECPTYFQSDWLNEFCDDNDLNDYKFCYIGPQDSFTSFHADVYGSYSWSANVFGIKKWYLYPPSKEMVFYNGRKKRMDFCWDNPGVPGQDYVEVIQNAGECIFVPSGWHHVVWNLTDAVSINHNWFNGTNICYIWNVLQQALKDVEKELDDLHDIPEFYEQCQLVLKANHGMDYKGFFDILTHILEKRLKQKDTEGYKDATFASSSMWQVDFDINAISHVMEEHCLLDRIVQHNFVELTQALTTALRNNNGKHNCAFAS